MTITLHTTSDVEYREDYAALIFKHHVLDYEAVGIEYLKAMGFSEVRVYDKPGHGVRFKVPSTQRHPGLVTIQYPWDDTP